MLFYSLLVLLVVKKREKRRGGPRPWSSTGQTLQQESVRESPFRKDEKVFVLHYPSAENWSQHLTSDNDRHYQMP